MRILTSILFVTALACISCGNNSDQSVYAGEQFDEETAIVQSLTTDGTNARMERKISEKIIRTARLQFETTDPDKTYSSIIAQLKIYNGFVQNDQASKSYNRINRSLTVRVPSESFRNFIDDISEGVQYFDHKDITQDDVTEEFIDLEARLKAKRALEERYIELLSQAKNVKEMLEVESELSKIREEIEAREGRLNYLKDRVAMSTLTISFYKYTADTGATVSYGQKIKNAFVSGWEGLSVFFIGILSFWPLWILLALTLIFVRKMIRRRKKARKN